MLLGNDDFGFQPRVDRLRTATLATGAWMGESTHPLSQGLPERVRPTSPSPSGSRRWSRAAELPSPASRTPSTLCARTPSTPPAQLRRKKSFSVSSLDVDDVVSNRWTLKRPPSSFAGSAIARAAAASPSPPTSSARNGPESSPATRQGPPRSSNESSLALLSSASVAPPTASWIPGNSPHQLPAGSSTITKPIPQVRKTWFQVTERKYGFIETGPLSGRPRTFSSLDAKLARTIAHGPDGIPAPWECPADQRLP